MARVMPHKVAAFLRDLEEDAELDGVTRQIASNLLHEAAPPRYRIQERVVIDAGRPGPRRSGEVFRISHNPVHGWIYDVAIAHRREHGTRIATVVEALYESRLTEVVEAPKPGPHLARTS